MRGTLFVDYVRMLRARKDVDWSLHLAAEDLPYLSARIAPDEWYPMETFERLGLAILDRIADGIVETVAEWGRFSIDGLLVVHPDLLTPGDQRETLIKFTVLRASFFDFAAVTVTDLNDGEALISIAYQMGPRAEEAASNQTLGFFQRLLELSGAKSVDAKFLARSWAGDPETTLALTWE